MKAKFYLIIFLIFFCCKEATKTDKVIISIGGLSSKDSTEVVEELLEDLKRDLDVSENEIVIEECVFDQSTQTDEFLHNIEVLKEYTWNSETKTAEIVLNDHWLLTITRGGCNEFEMSAAFTCNRILDIQKDKQIIFDNIVWITTLLNDFDGEIIKKVIAEDKVSISKENEFNYYGNFMDEKLYEKYYFNFNNKDRTTFEVGYYYN